MTIEAKVRISAIVDQAIRSLRDVRNAYVDVGVAATTAKAKANDIGPGDTAGAASAAAAAKQSAAEILATKRAAAAETKRLAKEVADAERKAAKDAADAQKKIDTELTASKKIKRDQEAKDAKAANFAAYQQRALAPQLTDIVVGLSTGQSPFTVLLQQGGQLKDVFGGIGNAGRALLSVFTPLRVVVGGVAAVFALIAKAAYDGHQESDALNKSLALTGNIAATSSGQLNQAARDIAASQNVSLGSVKATLAALVASGSYTATSLNATASAVTALARLTGQSADDAMKAFDGQAEGVTAWAAKSNRAYNFLTVEQFKYIRSLEAQGRTQEALKVTNEALTATLTQRAVPAVGLLEKGWNTLGRSLSYAWDLLKSIGRDTTFDDKVTELERQVARLKYLDRLSNRDLPPEQQRASAKTQEAQAELDAARLQQNADQVRLVERTAAQLAENDKIEKATAAFQSALAQLDQAGAQKLLAQTLANLDQRQAAVDLAHDKGLTGEREYSLALNAIDRQRLQAQALAVEQQIRAQAALVGSASTPIEKLGAEAQVKQLEAQLIGIQGKIAQNSAEALSITARDSLEKARSDASEWAQVWQTAFGKIRDLAAQNAASRTGLITDQLARAKAEAEVATADIRKEVADLQRDLTLQLRPNLSPGQRTEVEAQIAKLATESKAAIEEKFRSGLFTSLKQQLGELTDDLALKEASIAAEVERGAETSENAERRKFAARAKAIPQLQQIVELLHAQSLTPDEKNAVQGAVTDIGKLSDSTTELGRTVRGAVGTGFGQMFSDIATGSKSALHAFGDFISGVAKAGLDLIGRRLGEGIANSLLPQGGGGILGSAVSFFSGLFHSGGIAGSATTTRAVSPSVFAFAPRYHTEGIAGLRPREVPAILLEGEEVLTEDNPRHIKNFKRGGAGGGTNVSVAVSVTGAQGSTTQQQAAGDELGALIGDAVDDRIARWEAKQSRVGGILSGRG